MNKRYAGLQYSLVQASVWSIYGVLLCYAQNYLLSQQLSNITVSSILGAACIFAVVFQLILTGLINRRKFSNHGKDISLSKVIIMLSIVILTVCGILMWIPVSAIGIAIIYGVGVVSLQMLPAFVNAMGMSAIQSGRTVNFGVARGIGSGAYAIASFFVGRWMVTMGYNVILITTMVLCVVISLVSYSFHAGQGDITVQEEKAESIGLWKFFAQHRRFTIFLIGCVLCAISHSLTTNYIFQITVSKGGASTEQGIASAIAALFELPAMFLFVYMVKLVRCDTWVKISGLFFALKALFILLAPNVTGLYAAMSFQLLGFALYSVSSVYYAGAVISPKYVLHSQSYLFAALNIGSVLALLIGGPVLETLDIQALMLFATAFGFVGFLLFLASTEKIKNV